MSDLTLSDIARTPFRIRCRLVARGPLASDSLKAAAWAAVQLARSARIAGRG